MDEELLPRIAAGDRAAFAELFRRRQAAVYRFALHLTGSPATAEDVTQETFLAVMRDAGRHQPGRASVLAWLCGIARNQARRRLEREHRLVALPAEDEQGEETGSVTPDPLGDMTRAENIEAVRRAVLSLPLPYREAVVACDLQEMSYADAAEALGCAVGTVRSRLHRGRALLGARLVPEIGDARGRDRESPLVPRPTRTFV